MKKFLLLMVSILIIASISEVYSQSCCPSGSYTQTSVTTVNPYSGCTFTINYCYYIEPSGKRNIFICSISVPAYQPDPPCDYSSFILNDAFWDFVDNEVILDLHTVDPFVPCNEQGGGPSNVVVETTKAKCQKTYLDVISGTYVIEACDDEPGECQNTYAICMLNGVPIKTHILGPITTGSGSCPVLNPELNNSNGACFSTCN